MNDTNDWESKRDRNWRREKKKKTHDLKEKTKDWKNKINDDWLPHSVRRRQTERKRERRITTKIGKNKSIINGEKIDQLFSCRQTIYIVI